MKFLKPQCMESALQSLTFFQNLTLRNDRFGEKFYKASDVDLSGDTRRSQRCQLNVQHSESSDAPMKRLPFRPSDASLAGDSLS